MTLPSRADLSRFALFLAAGGVNTLFGYGVFALLIWLGMTGTTAVILSTVAGVIFNFHTFRRVFIAQGLTRLPHFVGMYAVIMLVNVVLLHVLTRAGLSSYLAQALIVLAVAPCSFLAMRNFVFNVPAEPSS